MTESGAIHDLAIYSGPAGLELVTLTLWWSKPKASGSGEWYAERLATYTAAHLNIAFVK